MAKKIKIDLDKKRELHYGGLAMEAIEETTGRSFIEVFDELQDNPSATTVHTLLWAGMLHADEEVDRKDVVKMIGLGDYQEIVEKIGSAFQKSMNGGTREQDDKKKDKKASE